MKLVKWARGSPPANARASIGSNSKPYRITMYKIGITLMKNRIGKIVSPFAAALMLAGILASSTAFAGKKPGGGGGGGGTTTTPPAPTNFRVTAKTAYSIT